MHLRVLKNTVLFFVLIVISCGYKSKDIGIDHNRAYSSAIKDSALKVGANRLDLYLPLLKGKRVGVVANQTSVIFKNTNASSNTHLVDSLLRLTINIKKVFAPEHGFRGVADAGELIKDGIDLKTKLPIVSLYGNNKKPSKIQLDDIDIMIFDIQDVGARFYTYISTLHYVMEACAEQNIPLLILDRPNPNGYYIDGPILEPQHQSFVGMHPVPIVHGLTIGEYAKMINGEKWLINGIQCDITVIPIENYTHQTIYSLPIKPSPNLPNDVAINLYPSLCLFEGTNVSVGRGTNLQFQIIGSPFFNKAKTDFSFMPIPNEGAKSPLYEDQICYGIDLSEEIRLNSLNLEWLLLFYKESRSNNESTNFFNDFFVKLAGTENLKTQIEAGWSSEKIIESWQADLKQYKETRKKYLLYQD